MLTRQEIDEWDVFDPQDTNFWQAVKCLTPEEREKLAKLASEDIKTAAQAIMAELKKEKGNA